MMPVTIEEKDLKRILKPIGFPFSQFEDLEVTEQDIIDIAVEPALEEYYRWFPIKERSNHTVAGNFTIPFPSLDTYGVTHHAFIRADQEMGSTVTNPFIAERIFNQSSSSRMYGTANDYGMDAVEDLVRMRKQSRADNARVVTIRTNHDARQVEGYSNVTGRLVIEWASYSLDWSRIPFRRKREVELFASALVLEFLGDLRKQIVDDVGVQFDADSFLQRAEEYKEEVYLSWKNNTHAVLVRG